MTNLQQLQYKKLQKAAKAKGFHFIGINANGSVHAFMVTYASDKGGPIARSGHWYAQYEGSRYGGAEGIKFGQIGPEILPFSAADVEILRQAQVALQSDPEDEDIFLQASAIIDNARMPFKEWKETLVKIW